MKISFWIAIPVVPLFLSIFAQAADPLYTRPGFVSGCLLQLKGENRYRLNLGQQSDAKEEFRTLVKSLETRNPAIKATPSNREQIIALWRPCFEPGSWQRASSGGYEAAGGLIPLKPFRSLIRFIDWEEHVHGTPSDYRVSSGVVNFMWGQVRNTRGEDVFAIGLTQIPFSDRFLLDFVLGPFDPRQTQIPSLAWAQGKNSDVRWMDIQGQSYLLARRLELRFGNLAAFEDLILRVQDLYLDHR